MKDLHRAKPCMLDAWTRDFMDCYDIEAADAKAILRLVLIMANTDTANIECWHACTRRVVTRLGAHTTRPNFYDVLARCQAQRMKRRAATQGAWVPRSDDSIGDDISRRIHAGDAMEKLDQRPPTKVRRGGGGPWRMHVSRQLQAGVPSFADHAASYRARGEAHKAQDAIDGAAATGRHRAGEPAFGPSQRQLEVARVRNLAVVFDRQNPISDASFLDSHASAIAPSLPEYTAEGLMSLLRVARQVGRMHSARAKLRHQDAQRAIVAYAQGAGRSAMRRATERLPALQQLQGSLHARPVPQIWGQRIGHETCAALSHNRAGRVDSGRAAWDQVQRLHIGGNVGRVLDFSPSADRTRRVARHSLVGRQDRDRLLYGGALRLLGRREAIEALSQRVSRCVEDIGAAVVNGARGVGERLCGVSASRAPPL